MKLMLPLMAFVAATPALAHPTLAPHAHTDGAAFSPLAAVVALGLVGAAVMAAPHLRAAFTRVTAR